MSITRQHGPSSRSVREVSITYPTATKTHRCLFCNGPIYQGTRHIKAVYVDNEALGGAAFRSSRTHLNCGSTK